MRVAFLGCTKYSEELLLSILSDKHVEVVAIFSIPEYFNISYSEGLVKNTNFVDLEVHATKHNIPYTVVTNEKGHRLQDYHEFIESLHIDILLVLGWYYMVPKSITTLATLGAWGIHASLLPSYAGGAPLVWAIIEGQTKTGVTLFRLEDGVDDGDIILQEEFPILFEDTINEVYQKATEASIRVLQIALKIGGENTFVKQDKQNYKIYPQRTPADGLINLNQTALELYNFIRAQSSPYPGAYILSGDNKKIIIEKARFID